MVKTINLTRLWHPFLLVVCWIGRDSNPQSFECEPSSKLTWPHISIFIVFLFIDKKFGILFGLQLRNTFLDSHCKFVCSSKTGKKIMSWLFSKHSIQQHALSNVPFKLKYQRKETTIYLTKKTILGNVQKWRKGSKKQSDFLLEKIREWIRPRQSRMGPESRTWRPNLLQRHLKE